MPYTLSGNAAPYASPVVSLPARWDRADPSYVPPPEGSRFVAMEIDWSDYPAGVVSANVFGNTPSAQLSRIAAISVDNVDCGATVDFVFPDTGEVLTVPAYTAGIYPVFTNATSFYVVADGRDNSDVTRFKLHNTVPPPVTVAADNIQSVAALQTAPLNVNNSYQIVPAGTSGTLEMLAFSLAIGDTNPVHSAVIEIVSQGGSAGPVHTMVVNGTVGNSFPVVPNMRARFANGLFLFVTLATLAASNVAVTAFYRTP